MCREMGHARFARYASNIGTLRKVPHDAKAADKEDAVEGGAVERGQSGRVFGEFSRRFVVPKGCGRGWCETMGGRVQLSVCLLLLLQSDAAAELAFLTVVGSVLLYIVEGAGRHCGRAARNTDQKSV